METENLWNDCCEFLQRKKEIQTVTVQGPGNVCFCAELGNEEIIISKSTKPNSCRLYQPRRIGKNEFLSVANHFENWLAERETRNYVQTVTNSQNTSYIFGIMAALKNNEKKSPSNSIDDKFHELCNDSLKIIIDTLKLIKTNFGRTIFFETDIHRLKAVIKDLLSTKDVERKLVMLIVEKSLLLHLCSDDDAEVEETKKSIAEILYDNGFEDDLCDGFVDCLKNIMEA